jgi:integrase/recombinase XerD
MFKIDLFNSRKNENSAKKNFVVNSINTGKSIAQKKKSTSFHKTKIRISDSNDRFIEYDSNNEKLETLNLSMLSYNWKTVSFYKTDLKMYEKYLVENDLDYFSVDATAVKKFVDYISTTKKADGGFYESNTITRKIRSLNALYKKMEILGIIEVNPVYVASVLFRDLIPYSDSFNVRGKISLDIIRNVVKNADPKASIVIKILANSGLRVSELIGIKVKDVKLTEKFAIFKTIKIKNKQRIVYLPIVLYDEARKIFGQNKNFLIGNTTSKAYTRSMIWLWVKKAFKEKADVDVKPHALRAFYTTQMIENGKDFKEVAIKLGHSSVLTTLNVYYSIEPNYEKDECLFH